ncbi:hypothetical protein [Corynebacterium kalidii]|uniref:Uncharacterized protein n=1 Tax=Corynebacterium kalidii TaxID=2931982 RepID=A0A9X1WHK2_9CORY|nr:hypothetical protein [Corynebacterium kalidii]MCJ7859279.1 hypothetical protein [Corynebacterium kalidii]
MGISPDQYQPAWDGSPQDIGALSRAGGDLGGGLAGSMQDTVGGIAEGLMNGLRGILTGGPFAPAEEAGEEFRNGQLDLNDRIDLLFGISGYGFSYMSKNINAQWSLNSTRRMPFDKQLGPAKNTHITEDGRLSLDGAGAWLILVKAHARGTGFTGSAEISMTTRVRRPNGDLYHQTTDNVSTFMDTGIVNHVRGPATILAVFPVVVDEPGCTVEAETWTGAWRWWDGGTRYSMMAAIRHSTDTENRGDETVPDETESEAGQ